MTIKNILIFTYKNKLYRYNVNTVKEALNLYIENVLGFNKRFEMSKEAWTALNDLDTSKPTSVKVELINGLCKFSRDKISQVIVGSDAYPSEILSKDFQYEIDDDYTYITINKYSGEEETLIIEDSYNGIPVRIINNSAFKNCTSLIEIITPDSIDEIDSSAFCGCTNLKHATLGRNANALKEHAFKDCINLESITIPKNLLNIDPNVFENCPKLSIINFTGTRAQWENRISKYWKTEGNACLLNATINYNYIG